MDIFAVSSGQKASKRPLGAHTWVMERSEKAKKATKTYRVTIIRFQKTAAAGGVRFRIIVVESDAKRGDYKAVIYNHGMSIYDEDQNRGNKSTLGYGWIYMPDGMKGLGIGYIYHWAAAMTADLLGVDYFVVNNATTPAMNETCRKSGMVDGWNAMSYEAAPGTVTAAAFKSAINKGWKPIQT